MLVLVAAVFVISTAPALFADSNAIKIEPNPLIVHYDPSDPPSLDPTPRLHKLTVHLLGPSSFDFTQIGLPTIDIVQKADGAPSAFAHYTLQAQDPYVKLISPTELEIQAIFPPGSTSPAEYGVNKVQARIMVDGGVVFTAYDTIDVVYVAPDTPLPQVNVTTYGDHGSVSPMTQKVDFGITATLQLSPEAGYSTLGIIDNATYSSISNPYTINSVVEDHDVIVVFGKKGEQQNLPPEVQSMMGGAPSHWNTISNAANQAGTTALSQ